MRLAVIQYRLRATGAADFEGLAEAIARACSEGADVIVAPRVEAIQDGPTFARPFLDRVGACLEGRALLVPFAWQAETTQDAEAGQPPVMKPTPLGSTVLLSGDECLDPEVLALLGRNPPEAVVMRPAAESPLQAEAFIELALAMSTSLAGVVVVCDPIGAGADPPGFGGSCIAVIGEVVAEAEDIGETELLLAEVDAPVVIGVPRDPVPQVPPILQQRWAHHHGRKVPVDYPADLS